MFETLYKTDIPAELEHAEYYQPHLDVEVVNGRAVYFVREKHGWYSERDKKAFHNLVILSPDEGFDTFEVALNRYNEQLTHRASEGFVFAFDPYTGSCRRIESGERNP